MSARFELHNAPLMSVTLTRPVESPIGSIPETLRSESCQATKGRAEWNTSDLHLFKPERWLQLKDGEEVFDSNSAPLLTFGLGPKGCFGRRMAYLELKITERSELLSGCRQLDTSAQMVLCKAFAFAYCRPQRISRESLPG